MQPTESWGVDAIEALMMTLIDPRDAAGAVAAGQLTSGGRRVRARLAQELSLALGATADAGVAWGAACELLHNAALVHDDLQDQDRVRRGHPTVWAEHGAARAITVGDLLLMLPFRAVGRVPAGADVRWRLADCLARHAEAAARGQYLELELPRLGRTDRASWEAVARGKTGAFFALIAEGAAILGGVDEAAAEALGGAFADAGVCYQACDDLNDLLCDNGKGAPGSDLREGRMNLVVVEHLARHPDDAERFLALLRAPPEHTSRATIAEAVADLVRGGGAHAAAATARAFGARCIASIALGDGRARALAGEMVAVFLARMPPEVAR